MLKNLKGNLFFSEQSLLRFFPEKANPSMRRGRKAADLVCKRKIVEQSMDDFWQTRLFCSDSSIKGKGGEWK